MAPRSEADRTGLPGPVWHGHRRCRDEALPLRWAGASRFARPSDAIPRPQHLPICVAWVPRHFWPSGRILAASTTCHSCRPCLSSSRLGSSRWLPMRFTPIERSTHSVPASSHGNSGREFVRDAYPVCLRWDLGIGEWDSTNLNVAVYLCNQMIYSPHRRHRQEESLTVCVDGLAVTLCFFAYRSRRQPDCGLARCDEKMLSAQRLSTALCEHVRAGCAATDRALLRL